MNLNNNVKLSWKSSGVTPEIDLLLNTLADEYPLSEGGRGLKMKFKKINSSGAAYSRVTRSKGEVLIEYSTTAGAARGVGTALAREEEDSSTPFKSLGIMLDVSRGMVMRV